MSLVLFLILSSLFGANAFLTAGPTRPLFRLASDAEAEIVAEESLIAPDDGTFHSQEDFLITAQRLARENGKLLLDNPQARNELEDAVKELEETSDTVSIDPQTMLGDWTLVISTATGGPTNPSFESLPSFLKDFRSQLIEQSNQNIKVTQRIRSIKSTDEIDRVDHVLEFSPPDLPNPLEITQTKVILVHQAELKGVTTKLALTSLILNVAGNSQQLDPQGQDIASLNLPFGDLLNVGDFETTYLSDTLRISRGKVGWKDQLRVFTRPATIPEEVETEVADEDPTNSMPSDVDE